MDIKSTFLIFFVSLGIFAATLAYNLNLYLSSRNITKKVASIERAKTTRKTIPAGVSDNVNDPGNLLSLTNIFSPRSGMDIPGKWSDKTSHVVEAGDVSSDFRLSGTIYSEQEELRRAVFFFTQKREEKAFKEGDYVDQNTRLLTIERNLAVVSVGGKKMAIKVIPDEKKLTLQRDRASRSQPARNKTGPASRKVNADLKISKIDESTFAVDESSVDYLTENINKVITQVRIIPYFESGEAAGFRFAAIRPGSVFSELGFTSGDVIKQINGVPLTSPEKIYTIFQNLKDEQRIQVDILRRGQKKTIGYEIR